MEQTEKDIIAQVVDLIRKGENKQAVNILAKLLAQNPKLEQGWLLMGLALEDPERKRFAFERTLKLNPDNDRAKQQLLKLEDEDLPKAPTPIQVEPPASMPPLVEEPPLVSTPWIIDEPEEEAAQEQELELPSWARDITPPAQESTPSDSFKTSGSLWEWEDEFTDDLPASKPERTKDQPAFTSFPEIEEEPEEKPKRRGWFGRRKSEESDEKPGKVDQPETEPTKRKRWKSRKERKEEKLAADEQAEEKPPEKSLQEQLLEGEKKPRFRINWRPRRGLVIFFILIIICGALGGGAYYYQDALIPLVTQYAPTVFALLTPEVTPTPGITITPTNTLASQPVMPPTWTPAVTEGGSRTIPTLPDFSIAPTITPTPLPLEPAVLERMDIIAGQIMALRELGRYADVDREIMPTTEFRSYMEALVLSRYDPEAVSRQQLLLEALGFVADEYYHVEVMMNDTADFVGGYFYPEQNKIYVPGNGFYAFEQYIYAYEYSFALLERNYNLTTRFCQGNLDSCLAQTALATGDVRFMHELWLDTYPIDFEPEEFFDLEDPEPLFKQYWAPPYFNTYRNFPVRFGYPFVLHLYEQNGWQTINYTYRYPPETTEQVLHPEKYDAREARVLLYDPDLLPTLGDGWELVQRETLGEWRTYLLLVTPDYPGAIRPEEEAAEAAAGWGGDTFQMYTNPESGAVVLAVHWNWDTAADREEFFTSFTASQAGRFLSGAIDGPGEGECWQLQGAFSCVYQNNRDVLWIYTTDEEALETAKSAFGQFD